jgi:hypothetical protein
MSRLKSLLFFVRRERDVCEPLVSPARSSMILRRPQSSISPKFFSLHLLASARAKVSPLQALLQQLLMEQDCRSCPSEFQVQWRRPVSVTPLAFRLHQH